MSSSGQISVLIVRSIFEKLLDLMNFGMHPLHPGGKLGSKMLQIVRRRIHQSRMHLQNEVRDVV